MATKMSLKRDLHKLTITSKGTGRCGMGIRGFKAIMMQSCIQQIVPPLSRTFRHLRICHIFLCMYFWLYTYQLNSLSTWMNVLMYFSSSTAPSMVKSRFLPASQFGERESVPQITICGTPSISPLVLRIWFLIVILSSPLSRNSLTSFSSNPPALAAFIKVSMLAGGCASSKYDLYNESRTLTLEPFCPFSCA